MLRSVTCTFNRVQLYIYLIYIHIIYVVNEAHFQETDMNKYKKKERYTVVRWERCCKFVKEILCSFEVGWHRALYIFLLFIYYLFFYFFACSTLIWLHMYDVFLKILFRYMYTSAKSLIIHLYIFFLLQNQIKCYC